MGIIRNIIRYRELTWVLIVREINVRYRQSLLGIGWAVVQPVGLTLLGIVLRGILKGSAFSLSEGVTVYVAVLPWTFFANAVTFSTGSVVRNAALLRKIYFPREVFVVSAVLTSLIDFFIGGSVLIVLLIVTGTAPTMYMLYLPLLLLLLVALALGVGLFTSALAVYKRDIMYGISFLLYFWMFLSPVWLTLEEFQARLSPGLFRLALLNPIAGPIDGFRKVIFEGRAPEPALMLCAMAVTVAVLAAGSVVFKRLETRFADVV